MDIVNLRLALKEEYTYQNTTKEIFLDQIQAIFEEHKNSGDTELLIYSGQCMASFNECPNCGKKGFRFIGNNSRDYFDLIFETDGDDIKDIFDCSSFDSDVKIEELKDQGSIYIKIEDKISFVKTPEYLSKVNAAEKAMAEIVTSPPKIVDFETLCYWVDKNLIVKKQISGDYSYDPLMKWSSFLMLFSTLNNIKCFLNDNLEQLIEANNNISENQTEEELINWVLEYEYLNKNAPYQIIYILENQNGYYNIDINHEILFSGFEFDIAITFFSFYNYHYYNLLEKHTTYTNKESIEAHNNQECQKNGIDIISLRFHIERRKAMEEIGIIIPFFLSQIKDNNSES